MNDRNNIRDPGGKYNARDSSGAFPAGEYTPGKYKEEAKAFLRECLGEEMYISIMSSAESRRHPYIAARVFLSDEQWAKYIWIERCGSLEGFSE